MAQSIDREILQKLRDLENRVASLEERLRSETYGDFVFVEDEAPAGIDRPPKARLRQRAPSGHVFSTTQVLGWTGVLALVLAAAYLIKLGIDLGWLTPARQVVMAFLGGIGLVAAGLALKRADRVYAALLPAGGVAILFMTLYGAHLYYRLVAFPAAVGGVTLVCLLSLWLCRHFASELYAYLAIVGSYSAPLLLTGLRAEVPDLAIYYSAWSLLFCAFALWLGQRSIYLAAAYLALLGFDFIWYLQWHTAVDPHWQAALAFQALQFAVFAVCTAIHTLRYSEPLDRNTAIGHLPPLLLFYALEYSLLDRYLHHLAPWIALGSLAILLAVFFVAQAAFSTSLDGGRLIVTTYAAVALFHAVYLEILPDSFAPWVGLGTGMALAAWHMGRERLKWADWPLAGALVLVFVINALRAMLNFDMQDVVGGDYLGAVYAAELYAGYVLVRKKGFAAQIAGPLLYVGHLSAMAAPVHIFDDRLPVSFCWAVLAVISLVFGLRLHDRLLAQSSLFVFAVSGVKVLMYDLDQAAPLIRIGCLVILGVSFYIGGWLYRKVEFLEPNT